MADDEGPGAVLDCAASGARRCGTAHIVDRLPSAPGHRTK